MEIAKAVAAAEKNADVQAHIKAGYYLSSLMAIPEQLTDIDEWVLVYFNPKAQKVFSVEVADGKVKKGAVSTPLVEGHYPELDYSGALADAALLSKITTILAEQREFPTRVIITLREGLWKVAVVTRSLKMLLIDMDKASGEVKTVEKTSLVSTDDPAQNA